MGTSNTLYSHWGYEPEHLLRSYLNRGHLGGPAKLCMTSRAMFYVCHLSTDRWGNNLSLLGSARDRWRVLSATGRDGLGHAFSCSRAPWPDIPLELGRGRRIKTSKVRERDA